MGGHCLSPYTCKHCIVFKQFDGLNFDGLAGKFQNIKIFPMKIVRYMLFSQNSHVTKINVIAIPHM